MSRDWSQFNFDYEVVTSPSRIETFFSCPRQWAFDKIFRLPLPPFKPGPFGEALHGVAERFALADRSGRDPKGDIMELYPDGWDSEIPGEEADLIQKLITKAIESGHLRKIPNALPESAFQRDVIDSEGSHTGGSIIGFGDLIAPDGYEDYKTTKSFSYCLTEEELEDNIQMMIGAAEVFTRASEQGLTLEQAWIRHLYFSKDRTKLAIKPVEAFVTKDMCRDFWFSVVVPIVQGMVKWKRKFKKHDVDRWEEIPRATESGVCKKYGGCPFRRICNKIESPDQYTERLSRQIDKAEQKQREEGQIMGIFDSAKKRNSPVPTKAPVEPAVEEEVVDAADEEVVEDDQPTMIAPWHVEGCVSCSDNPNPGYNTAGNACRACESAQRRRAKGDRIFSVDFDDLGVTDGVRTLKHKTTGAVYEVVWSSEVAVKEAAAPKSATQSRSPRRRARLKDKVDDATADEPQASETKEPDIVPPVATTKAEKPTPTSTGRRERSKRGFTLVYGVVKRGRGNVQDAHQLMLQYGNALAEHLKAESYYLLDYGKRRDMLASRAKNIAEEIGTAVVTVTGNDPDVLAFASALEPFAYEVFIGGRS